MTRLLLITLLALCACNRHRTQCHDDAAQEAR